MTAETITKRKLSELIREGAKLRPQGFDNFFDTDDKTGDVLCSCALGAAVEAAYGEPQPTLDGLDEFRSAMRSRCYMPNEQTLMSIVNKNDDNRMTREEIADWLEADGY